MRDDDNDHSAGLIGQTIPEVAETEPRLTNGQRYCPMCDEFMKPRVCKACGMPTEKVPNGDV